MSTILKLCDNISFQKRKFPVNIIYFENTTYKFILPSFNIFMSINAFLQILEKQIDIYLKT